MAYCAETVAITYEEMGLLVTDKDAHWFDSGKFWAVTVSGAGLSAGHEIAVDGRADRLAGHPTVISPSPINPSHRWFG